MQVTAKPDQGVQPAPIHAVEAGGTAVAGVVDFGNASGKRKPLFQFAKRTRTKALGPSRSEYGCD